MHYPILYVELCVALWYFQEHMIQNEVAILRKVKHPNIIELKEEFNSHLELYLVMELVKVRKKLGLELHFI